MINLYSGTPGSGKSLHLARYVLDEINIRNHTVIGNFPVNTKLLHKGLFTKVFRKKNKQTAEFIYKPNHEITVPFLIDYAQKHHKVGVEGQTLLVIDEAGIMFNSRDYGQYDRKAWIQFFMTHRHYGFNVILVSQFDRMLDRQIRAFIEYEVKHRKANNFRFIGLLLTLLHIPVFVAITYWYGMRERCSSEFFRYRKRDSQLYDTMMLFGGDQHGQKIGIPDTPAPGEDGDTERSEEGTRPHRKPPQSDNDVFVDIVNRQAADSLL